MRNRFALSCLLFILCFPIAVPAESLDLSQMDYDNLCALKQQVDMEFNSRPESKPFTLIPGEYEVGKDIKPGRYFALADSPVNTMNDYSYIYVYPDKESFDKREPYAFDKLHIEYALTNTTKSFELVEGSFIWVSTKNAVLSVADFSFSDIYQYKMPEGTYVPAGRYIVGIDIPIGTYHFYSGTQKGGHAYGYASAEDSMADDYSHDKAIFQIYVDVAKSSDTYQTASLEEGVILVVETDVVMKKQQALVFE